MIAVQKNKIEVRGIDMLYELTIGIIGSMIGAVICALVWKIVKVVRESRYWLTGEWEQIIYEDEKKEKIIKKDRVKAHHIGELVEGTIERVFPDDQNHRKWKFSGRERGKLFFGHFWSSLPRIPSYGTLQLRQMDDSRLEGFYVRLIGILDEKGEIRKFTEELKTIPFEWRKK